VLIQLAVLAQTEHLLEDASDLIKQSAQYSANHSADMTGLQAAVDGSDPQTSALADPGQRGTDTDKTFVPASEATCSLSAQLSTTVPAHQLLQLPQPAASLLSFNLWDLGTTSTDICFHNHSGVLAGHAPAGKAFQEDLWLQDVADIVTAAEQWL
jgi:hypothetical protein